MPKLLMFAPCDNVLISGENQSASLIIVLTQIVYQGTIPDPFPPNAMSPMRWSTFSQWEFETEDSGINFQQKITLVDDAGQEAYSNQVNFTGIPSKSIHRVVTTNFGFPLLAPGVYRLKLSYQRAAQGDWQEVADYPLEILWSGAVPAPLP